MAKSKTATQASGKLKRLAEYLRAEGRPLLVSGLILAVFLGGWYYVWREVRGNVLAAADYTVTPQNVEITPLPIWIHSDLRSEVLGATNFSEPLSLLDDGLTERIAAAFAMHPWVAKVVRVTKHHPARVEVELAYRRPLLMVDTPSGLLPVDVAAVLLPNNDFSPVEKARYPRLTGIETAPLGTVGEQWGDARVYGAAQIVALVGDGWQQWKLDRIVPSTKPVSNTPDDYIYALLTRSGTQVVWGRAPYSKVSGELPAAEKLARIRQYVATNGTLEGRTGPQQLDVRSMPAASR